MSSQTSRHERSNILCEDSQRSILRSIRETRTHVGDVGERERGVAEAEVLFQRRDPLVVKLRAKRERMTALHACGRLRLVAKRSRQVELVANSRAQTLRV